MRNAKAHVHSGSEWELIVRHLVGYNILELGQLEDAFHAHGQPVLNGAFGVGKGKPVPGTETHATPLETQRLIINLNPTNQLQRPNRGDVPLLP